jgi:DNA transformation protein
MKKEDSYRDFVLDQLRLLEDVSCRAMFGGYGLYLGADFFSIRLRGVFGGTIKLRTIPATLRDFLS